MARCGLVVALAVGCVSGGCVSAEPGKTAPATAAPDSGQGDGGGCVEEAFFDDADGDGHGAGQPVSACEAPPGTVATGGDCDDGDPAVHPGATEHCDGVDEDCDGSVDEDAVDMTEWWVDADGDGHGRGSLWACAAPEAAVVPGEAAEDCDDADPAVYPGAPELCDEVDQDCDGELGFDAVAAAAGPSVQELVDNVPDGSEVCLPAGTWPGPVELEGRVVRVVGAGPDLTALAAPPGGVALTVRGESAVELEDLAFQGSEAGGGGLLLVEDGAVTGRALAVQGLEDAPGESPVRVVGGAVTLEDLRLRELVLEDRPLIAQSGGVVVISELEGDGLELSAWYQGALVEVEAGELSLWDAALQGLEVHGALVGLKDGATVTLARFRLTDSAVEVRDRGGVIQQHGGRLTADALVVAGNTFTGSGSFGARGAVLYTGGTGGTQTTLRNLSWVGNRAVADWLVEVKFPQTTAVIENCDFSDIGEDPSGAVGGATALALSHIADADRVQLDLGWNNVEPDVELFYGGCAGTACDGVELGPVLRESAPYVDTSAASAADWDLHLVAGSLLIDGGNPDCSDTDGTRCDVGAHGGPLGAW